MAKPLRIDFTSALYYVTSQGKERDAVYVNDQDRQIWLDVLGRVCGRYDRIIHAHCRMGNHHHLFVQTPNRDLAEGMRQPYCVYTQHFNTTEKEIDLSSERSVAMLTVCGRLAIMLDCTTRPLAELSISPKSNWTSPSCAFSSFRMMRAAHAHDIDVLRDQRQGKRSSRAVARSWVISAWRNYLEDNGATHLNKPDTGTSTT